MALCKESDSWPPIKRRDFGYERTVKVISKTEGGLSESGISEGEEEGYSEAGD